MPFPATIQQIQEIEQEKFQLELKFASLKFQIEQDDQRISDYIDHNSLGLVIAEQTIVDLYVTIENYIANAENSIPDKILMLFAAARNILLIKILLEMREKYAAGIEIVDLTESRLSRLRPLFYEIEKDDDILECRSYFEDLMSLAIEMQQHQIVELATNLGIILRMNPFFEDFLIDAAINKSSYKEMVLAVRKIKSLSIKSNPVNSDATPSASYLEVLQNNTSKLYQYIAESNLQQIKILITKLDLPVQQQAVIQAIEALQKCVVLGVPQDNAKEVLRYVVDAYYLYDPSPDFNPLKFAIISVHKAAFIELRSYVYPELKISKESLIDAMDALQRQQDTNHQDEAQDILKHILYTFYLDGSDSDFNPLNHAILSRNINTLKLFQTYGNPKLILTKEVIKSLGRSHVDRGEISKYFNLYLERVLKDYITGKNYQDVLHLMSEYASKIAIDKPMAEAMIYIMGGSYKDSDYKIAKAALMSLLDAYAASASDPAAAKVELVLQFISAKNHHGYMKIIFEVTNMLQNFDMQSDMLFRAFFRNRLDNFIFCLENGATAKYNSIYNIWFPEALIQSSCIHLDSEQGASNSFKREAMKKALDFLSALEKHDKKSSIFVTPVGKNSLLKIIIKLSRHVDFSDPEIKNNYMAICNLLINNKLQLEDDILSWALIYVYNREILVFILNAVRQIVDGVVFLVMLRCVREDYCTSIDQLMLAGKVMKEQGEPISQREDINMKIKLLMDLGQKINQDRFVIINDFEYVGMAIRNKDHKTFNVHIFTINSPDKFKFVYDRIDNLTLRNGDEVNQETNNFVDQIIIPDDHLIKILCSSYGYALKNKALQVIDQLDKNKKQLMKVNGDFEKIKQNLHQSNPSDAKLYKKLKAIERTLVESDNPKAVLFSRSGESQQSVSGVPMRAANTSKAKPKML